MHIINDGTRAVFVLGNRYAPAYFEGCVPESLPKDLDLLARSGVAGEMLCKSNAAKDPTRIRVLGYICDESGQVINTRDFPLTRPRIQAKREKRAKMILSIGTAMNSGKSTTAVAACSALATMGYTVRELEAQTSIPVFNNLQPDPRMLSEILLRRGRRQA